MKMSLKKDLYIEKLRENRDIKGLIKALRKKSTYDSAADALIEIGNEAIPQLIKKLDTWNTQKISPYAKTLVRFGEITVPSLLETLGNLKWQSIVNTCNQICMVLAEIGDERAIETLCRLRNKYISATGKNKYIKIALHKILKPPYQTLLELTNSNDKDTKIGAFYTLQDLGMEKKLGEYAIEPLVRILQENPDSKVRQLAVYVLGWIFNEKVIEPLTKALEDSSRWVKGGAKSSLKRVNENLQS